MFLRAVSLSAATLLLLTVNNVVNGAGQAVCGLHSRYLNTKSGHTPCDVAAILVGGGVKSEDSPFPELLGLGVDRYPAPSGSDADDLHCNPLFYNLVSACGSCQGSRFAWTTWDEWRVNCKSISALSHIAQSLPGDIPLANWAFIPPSATNGTWNNEVAFTETEKGIPDSYFPKLVITQSNACNKLSPGGIAGSVIGAALGLALLGGLAVFIARRRSAAATNTKGAVHVQNLGDNSSVNSIMKERVV